MTTPLPTGWEADILHGIGAPVTPSNVQTLDTWQRAEGGSTNNPDAYNPLDTTQPFGGSHGTNSVGVQAYPDWQSGLAATVETLNYGYYKNIVADLRASAPYSQTAGDVNASPWGSHLPGAPSTGGSPGGGSGGGGGASGIGDFLNGIGKSVASGNFPSPADIAGGAASNVFVSGLKALIANGFVMRGTLIVTGLIILFIGLSQLSKSDTAGGTAASGAQKLTVTVKHATAKGAEAGGTAAA